jgi:putative transposase
MASKPRYFHQHGAFHIYNRGNSRQPIFHQDFDYKYFLSLIKKNAAKYKIKILAYCLMRNHVHFAVQQLSSNNTSISKWFGNSTMSYVHYYNRRYDSVGHIFQDAFKSRLVCNDEDLMNLINYIHNNPSDFMDPLGYPWSSVRELSVIRRKEPRVLSDIQG